VQRCWTAEDEAIVRGDLAAAADVNVRFWIDGPGRRPEDVDPELRRRAHAMQLRALELQVPSYARRIVASLPDTTEASIPDAAHLPSMERPELFDRLLADFLSGPA